MCHTQIMPKRSSGPDQGKPEIDINQLAAQIVETVTHRREGKNPAAVALGKLGGLKGGRARAEKLSPRRRSAIARRAAKAMWARRKAST